MNGTKLGRSLLVVALASLAFAPACTVVQKDAPDTGTLPQDDTDVPGTDGGVDSGKEVEPFDTNVPDVGATETNPCGDLTVEGKCLDSKTATWCDVPTGSDDPKVVVDHCGATEECTVDSDGVANCTLKAGLCDPGATECNADKSAVRTCGDDGKWTESVCPTGSPGCDVSSVGAFCRDVDKGTGGTVTSVSFSGSFKYEYRQPNSATTPTDWSSTIKTAPGVRITVVSYRGESLIDATETDDSGNFTLKVPSPAKSGDKITFWAVRAKPGGLEEGIAFGMGLPDVPDGTRPVSVPGDTSQFWGWDFDLTAATSGSTFTITEAKGSGALRVFDYLRYAYDVTYFLMKTPGKSIVIWLRYNTAWECGACQSDTHNNVGDYEMQSQIFIPAVAADTAYWSDAVTAHELGHWVMASHGKSPGEGGRHCIGVPTFPGQAWSEGWATLFSSMVREDSVYVDKQRGSMFWFDIDRRKYPGSTAWKRPTAAAGLKQLIDENEVSAMGWAIATHPTTAGTTLSENKLFLDALASDRMRLAPFGRGYTRHVWSMSGCTKTSESDLGTSSVMFADYLDALRCQGVPASTIDAVTNPTTNYPFPSSTPICK
jgi:hypothetical protein